MDFKSINLFQRKVEMKPSVYIHPNGVGISPELQSINGTLIEMSYHNTIA